MEELDVRLEFVAAVAIDAHRVARFVQELKDVPNDAWCEVRNVWSTSTTTTITTAVQMACDRRVADFLCQRFAKQTRHVSQGEVLLVKCRRVCLRSLPTTSKAQNCTTMASEGPRIDDDREELRRQMTLPRATVIDLIDCLGDQIADVLDAFEAFADCGDHNVPQLTVIGLVHALKKLSKAEGKVPSTLKSQALESQAKSSRRRNDIHSNDEKDPSVDQLAVHKVRHLLARLVTHRAIALTLVPEENDRPFMGYTDFIACYVAYVNSADNASHSSSRRYNTKPIMR